MCLGGTGGADVKGGKMEQLLHLLYLAGPVYLEGIATVVLQLTSILFVGRLGSEELAGIGLGLSFCSFTGVALHVGLATGIDILCAQAYGAGKHRLVGVALARGTAIVSATFFPVALAWWYSEDILLFVGLEPGSSHLAGSFARFSLPGLVPAALLENLKRCLQAQNVVWPILYVTLASGAVNVALHYVLVYRLALGVEGAAMALASTQFVLLFAMIWAVRTFSLGEPGTWSGLLSREAFQGWPQYISLALPGMTAVLLEQWVFEGTLLLAGYLGETALAAQTVLLNLNYFLFMCALALSVAASVRVGNQLGAADGPGARLAALAAVGLAACTGLCLLLAIVLGRRWWPRWYTGAPEVIQEIQSVVYVLAVFEVVDAVQFTCGGIFKGMGRPQVQVVGVALGFWVAGIPLAIYLSLARGWGIVGIWSGIVIGEIPVTMYFLAKLALTDWEREQMLAVARVEAAHTQNGTGVLGGVNSGPGSSEDGSGGGQASLKRPGLRVGGMSAEGEAGPLLGDGQNGGRGGYGNLAR